jgi:large subunit ribosomal protein L23
MRYDKYDIVKYPLITEKSTDMKENEGTVGFIVDIRANKHQIKRAVEEIFKVKVDSVRVVIKKGKPKRYGRFTSKGAKVKKAYVKLKKGEKMIEFFEAV